MHKWVYRFDEVDQAEAALDNDWDQVRGLLGGKGANLGDMSRIGVPVPPGFTITTEACNAYLASEEHFTDSPTNSMLRWPTQRRILASASVLPTHHSSFPAVQVPSFPCRA